MRTNLENYLTACINSGWCDTSGDVESPTGAFALVSSHETHLDLADFAESAGLESVESIPLGHLFGVVEDSQGFLTVTDFGFECYGDAFTGEPNAEQRKAREWFDKLDAEYCEWDAE